MRYLSNSKLIALAVWLVAIITAIFFLRTPSFNTLETTPEFSVPASQTWQHGLDKATEVDLTFLNFQGHFSKSQKSNINQKMRMIAQQANYLGINRISTPQDDFVTKHFQSSNDRSVLIYRVFLNGNKMPLRTQLSKISQLTVTPGVKTSLSGPSAAIVSYNMSVERATHIVMVALAIGMLLITGILFRSLLAPFISLLMSITVYLLSNFSVQIFSHLAGFPYSIYTKLTITILAFGALPAALVIFYRIYSNEMDNDVTGEQIFSSAWYQSIFWLLPVIITLIGSYFAQNVVIKSLAGGIPTLVIAWLAFFTLLPIITTIFGDQFFWPGPAWLFDEPHRFWKTVSNFSLHEPLIIVIGLVLIISPFFFLKTQFSYDINQTLTSDSQALAGDRVSEAHFDPNVSNSATIFINNKNGFKNPKTLAMLDSLTNRLKADPQVAAVNSLTQPVGIPIDAMYVNNQLGNVDTHLQGSKVALDQSSKELKKAQFKLDNLNLARLQKQLNTLGTNIHTNASDTATIRTQNKQLVKDLKDVLDSEQNAVNSLENDKHQSAVVSQAVTDLKSNIDDFSTIRDNLNTVNQNLGIVGSNGTVIKQEHSYISKKFAKTKSDLDQISSFIANSNGKIKVANHNIGAAASYLDHLRNSGVIDTAYISPKSFNQKQFKVARAEYSSANEQSTVIRLQLKGNPLSTANLNYVSQLNHELDQLTRGNQLGQSQPIVMGITNQQLKLKRQLTRDIGLILPIIVISVLVALILITQSLLQSIYSLLAVFSSYFVAQNISAYLIKYLFKDSLLWNAPTISLFVSLLIILTINSYFLSRMQQEPFRHLESEFESLGNVLNIVFLVSLMLALSFLVSQTPLFMQIALITTLTVAVFLVIYPLIMTSFSYYTYREFKPRHQLK